MESDEDGIDDSDIMEQLPDYLCEQTKGIFYSTPHGERDNTVDEITLNLKCDVVNLEYNEDGQDYKQTMIHYYMDKELEPMIEETKFSSEELQD